MTVAVKARVTTKHKEKLIGHVDYEPRGNEQASEQGVLALALASEELRDQRVSARGHGTL